MEFGGTPDVLHFLLRFGSCSNSRGGRNGISDRNITERQKEIATIKVLGFYDKEVYRYIFREIELLSLIGSGVGLLLGVPLHRFIILTVEMDQLMFIRTIAPSSYLLAVALTMLFTFVVCFAMRRHVRHISMVESMKAPE